MEEPQKTNKFAYNMNSIGKTELFIYAIIVLSCIFVASYFNFGINVMTGLIISGIIIYYYISNKNMVAEEEEEILKRKIKNIHKPPKIMDKYTELIDYFYSIRDFYPYNPGTYDAILANVESLLIILEDVKEGTINCKQNYEVAIEYRRNALNHLHSLIYSIHPNKHITKKLNIAQRNLNMILNKYVQDIKNICNKKTDEEGLNIDNGYIYDDIDAANIYDNGKELLHSLSANEHDFY